MKTYLIYNRQTPGEGKMQEVADRLERIRVSHELLDADTPRGIQLAENYQVFARPAVLVVRDDGSVAGLWDNVEQMPAPSDIRYLATS